MTRLRDLFPPVALVALVALVAALLPACDMPPPNIAPEYQNPQNTATNAMAQSVVRISGSAQAAGWDFVEKGQGDVRRVVELIVQGHQIDDPSSPFNGSVFRLPGLSIAQQEAVAERLEIQHGKLVLAPLY